MTSGLFLCYFSRDKRGFLPALFISFSCFRTNFYILLVALGLIIIVWSADRTIFPETFTNNFSLSTGAIIWLLREFYRAWICLKNFYLNLSSDFSLVMKKIFHCHIKFHHFLLKITLFIYYQPLLRAFWIMEIRVSFYYLEAILPKFYLMENL